MLASQLLDLLILVITFFFAVVLIDTISRLVAGNKQTRTGKQMVAEIKITKSGLSRENPLRVTYMDITS